MPLAMSWQRSKVSALSQSRGMKKCRFRPEGSSSESTNQVHTHTSLSRYTKLLSKRPSGLRTFDTILAGIGMVKAESVLA